MFPYNEVKEFYESFGMSYPNDNPKHIEPARRAELMAYLLNEVLEFGRSPDLLSQVDAATDLLFFVFDVFVELGVPPDEPFRIVCKANMAKLWPDGKPRFDMTVVPPKLIKPEGWEPPEAMIRKYLEMYKNGRNKSESRNSEMVQQG